MRIAATNDLTAMLNVARRMSRNRYQKPTILERENGTFFIRPWVDVVDAQGKHTRQKKVINLEGAKNKREAERIADAKMRLINAPDIVIIAQYSFAHLLDKYDEIHIPKLGAGTQAKYRTQIKNHIRPFFGNMMIGEVRPLVIQEFFDKKMQGLSWASRMDVRNILSGIFERAIFWELWHGKNPTEGVKVGKKAAKWEKRKKWTVEQTQRFLAALPEDVRLLCRTSLTTTLRVSELLGLRERHLEPAEKCVSVEERFYRGDIASTKTENSERKIFLPDGLFVELQKLCMGDPERHIFAIKTRPDFGKREALCRDDRAIHRYFLKPTAISLGLYKKGFGFHDLRREAITMFQSEIGLAETKKIAGHGSERMTEHYLKQEVEAQRAGAAAIENRLMDACPLAPKTPVKIQ